MIRTQSLSDRVPHVCILGGGFGGLYTAVYAQKFRALQGDRCRITLVEPRSHFIFSPLLYELLSDELAPWQVTPRYETLLANTNVERLQDAVTQIDLKRRRVILASEVALTYDYLVVALGSQTRFAPIPGLKEHALAFRTLNDARQVRQRLDEMRASERSSLAVGIIGAGPSGVELACKISDLLGDRGQIYLIERGSELLSPFTPSARRVAYKALNKRRVDLLFESAVRTINTDQIAVQTSQGERWLETDLVLWTAGAVPTGWLGDDAVPQNDRHQCRTRPTLQLPDFPEVFVLGDMADLRDGKGHPAPNTAQVAYQAADRAAANLNALLTKKPLKPFQYHHLGDMLTLGIGDALVDSSLGFTLGGPLAGLMRRIVYIYRLPTWRHRLKVARHSIRVWLKQIFGGALNLTRQG